MNSRVPKTPLLVSIALATMFSLGLDAQETRGSDSCTLLATLYNKPFPNEDEVPQVQITFDAHIAVRAEVERVVLGSCGFSPGDRVTFLIHSPTRMLGGYWFHDKRVYLTLRASDQPKTDRQWDLAGLDWPLSTETPFSENLICRGDGFVVRTLVGESNNLLGPFSVFEGDDLLISLGTLETIRARPSREDESFEIEYPGHPEDFVFKPRFRFEAHGESGSLVVDDNETELSCEWPGKE
jgi:hypothetical protein